MHCILVSPRNIRIDHCPTCTKAAGCWPLLLLWAAQQCWDYEQQPFISLHRPAFPGCKRKISVLWSDNRPHQGAFEDGSGQIRPEKMSFKSKLLFQQLATIQDPAVSPQVIFKTSPCCSHDNGCVPLFLYPDKNQIKSEPHGACLQSVPRGNN